MLKIQEDVFKDFKKSNLTQFFTQNKAMLGYSYPSKSLTIAVHELITNSFDNCINSGILPEIKIIIEYDKNYINTPHQKSRLVLTVEDNGSGIPEKHIPTIFTTFLQGTKFRINKQHMGMQGIGATGVILFSEVETGHSGFIKTGDGATTLEADLSLNLETGESKNKITKKYKNNFRGTLIKIPLGDVLYGSGSGGVEEYIKEFFLANPYGNITLKDPEGNLIEYKRVTNVLPEKPIIEKYHPLGLDAHNFFRLLNASKYKTVGNFLAKDLQKSSNKKVKEINEKIKRNLFKIKKDTLDRKLAESIISAIHEIKWNAPSTASLMPIGEENMLKAIDKLFTPEFKVAVTRKARVYRGGIPFIVEIGVAWGEQCGKKIPGGSSEPLLMRFANRVPLLFDSSADVVTQALKDIDIGRYIKSVTSYPLSIIANINSTFIPFNNAGKQAIDHDDDISGEFKSAMFQALRKISAFINKRIRKENLISHKKTFTKYVAESAKYLSDMSDNYKSEKEIKDNLEKMIGKIINEDEENEKE